MKTKYILDEAGSVIGGFIPSKRVAIALLVLFVLGGLLYSAIYAPAANAAEPVSLEFVTELRLDEIWISRIIDRTNEKTMSVSAYTSEARQTDATPEIGATGENIWKLLQKGIRTCASNDYPFGTKLDIPGIEGGCVVKDRMNRRYTGRGFVDVYMGYDHAAAWAFGRKTLNVKINP